jgi:aspartate aminotransferase
MDGHLRISFCGSEKDIVEGVARMRWALDGDGPAELRVGSRSLVRDW